MTVPQAAIDAATERAAHELWAAQGQSQLRNLGQWRILAAAAMPNALAAAEPFMRAEWAGHRPKSITRLKSRSMKYQAERDEARTQLAALTAQLQAVRELCATAATLPEKRFAEVVLTVIGGTP